MTYSGGSSWHGQRVVTTCLLFLFLLGGCSVEPTDADTARMDEAVQHVAEVAAQVGGTVQRQYQVQTNTGPLAPFRQDADILTHMFLDTEEPQFLRDLDAALETDPPDVDNWNVFMSDGDVAVQLRVLITQE